MSAGERTLRSQITRVSWIVGNWEVDFWFAVIRQLRIHFVSQTECRPCGYGRAFMASLSSTGITPTANAVPSSSPMDGRGF